MLHSVPSSELLKNPDYYFDHSLVEPLFIARNGRARLVMMSIDEYRRMARRSRLSILIGDLGEPDISLITDSKVPATFEKYNHEVAETSP